jgi:peptidoglycan/xylan/chitin deacetylase (PgdA/CDA1 family)
MTTNLIDLPPQPETEHYVPAPPWRAVPRGNPERVTLRQRSLDWLAAICQAACGPRERTGFGILMYHRIANPQANRPRPTWNVPPPRFEKQLKGLLRRGWQAWPLRQVLHYVERELPIPRKTFVITFDDGYANVLLHAYPVLTRLHLPATLFLSTAYLDSKQPFPSDDWAAAGTPGTHSDGWRPLTTDECRRLMGNGLVEIGAHTHTHGDFRSRPDELHADLAENLRVLREKFQIEMPTFALPYGTKADGFAAPDLIQSARKAGVQCCLNTEPDFVRLKDNPFDWGRFTATERDTAATLAGKLGGWRNALRLLGRKALDSRPRALTPGA